MPENPPHEPETMSMLRQALPALLRDSVTAPEGAEAVGAVVWTALGAEKAPEPQFLAYLGDESAVAAPIYPEAAHDIQSWAEAMVGVARDVDPEAGEGARTARLAAYAPLNGGEDIVDIWFGESESPWVQPAMDPQEVNH